ncbi:MAG: ABC transporter substrate-binding protein [Pseudomonadota bacterium]
MGRGQIADGVIHKASWLVRLMMISVFLNFIGAGPSSAKVIKIGLPEEPKTLNVWLASDAWSSRVLGLIYQTLYIREPKELKMVPWLAEEQPVYDPAALSYTIKLRPAKWSDGSELTSEDVAFTGHFIKEFKIPRFLSNWEFIKKIETPDKKTVKFFLTEPQAIFYDRTLLTPIVQKKEWEKVALEAKNAENPLVFLLNYKMERPSGSGPFQFQEWKKGAYLFLKKNKGFFGEGKTIEARQLGPYIDGIIFKCFGTSDTAIMALRKGSIDMFWWGIQPGYLEDLEKDKDIQIFCSERSALYYLGFNVRKGPFDDIPFRQGVATLIDKDFLITRVLQKYGVKMHSIVPSSNKFWYCPHVPKYGEGLSMEDRIRKAYDILRKAGYTWDVPPVDTHGKVVKGVNIKFPDGTPIERVTILTPPADYDPNRAMAGMMIQEWLKNAGIPAVSKPMAFGSLIQQVKGRREFDLFVLGYGKLSLDPDYLRNFFHSKNNKPNGWNMSGYHNPAFDRIADESVKEMDEEKRRQLIWQMQTILMQDVPYLPLYNPKLVEAVRKDKFVGWVEMLEGIGNLWSFCLLRPR